MIRAAVPGDIAFITSSWLQSFASSDVALLATPKDEQHTRACVACGAHSLRTSGSRTGVVKVHSGEQYWGPQRRLVEKLIATCNASVMENEDGLIDAWIVREWHRPVIHYVYARNSSRGRGCARALVSDLLEQPAMYSHKSRGLDSSRLPKQWKFSDYILKMVD